MAAKGKKNISHGCVIYVMLFDRLRARRLAAMLAKCNFFCLFVRSFACSGAGLFERQLFKTHIRKHNSQIVYIRLYDSVVQSSLFLRHVHAAASSFAVVVRLRIANRLCSVKEIKKEERWLSTLSSQPSAPIGF